MTIGIGVLCEGGKCIVMAADTKGTYPNHANLRGHHKIGKQFDLPLNFCCNIAGDVSQCSALESELYTQMQSLPAPFYHDHVRNAIRESQFYELTNRSNYALKKKLGITLLEWKALWLPQWLRIEGKKIINSTDLETQIMVGGFCQEDPVLLQADLGYPAEMQYFSTIGSGSRSAIEVLCKRKQDAHMSFQRSIVHVAEALAAAKRNARRTNPTNPDVGDPGDYVVITPKTFRRMPAKCSAIKPLLKQYRLNTEGLDGDDAARGFLLNALYYPGTTTREYALGFRRPIFDKFVWRGRQVHCDASTLRMLRGTSLGESVKPHDLQESPGEPEPK